MNDSKSDRNFVGKSHFLREIAAQTGGTSVVAFWRQQCFIYIYAYIYYTYIYAVNVKHPYKHIYMHTIATLERQQYRLGNIRERGTNKEIQGCAPSNKTDLSRNLHFTQILQYPRKRNINFLKNFYNIPGRLIIKNCFII